MSEESFDDGLVHGHAWSNVSTSGLYANYPVADVSGARVPSTVSHDDCLFCD